MSYSTSYSSIHKFTYIRDLQLYPFPQTKCLWICTFTATAFLTSSIYIYPLSYKMSNPLLVLVTGANQGLGYYATQILAKTGKYHILLGSRDLEKGKGAVKSLLEDSDISPSAIEPIQIDITSDES